MLKQLLLALVLGGLLAAGAWWQRDRTPPVHSFSLFALGTVVDLRVSLPLGTILGERPVEVFGRVENLLDKDYQTAAGYNQAPRGVFAGIRVGL